MEQKQRVTTQGVFRFGIKSALCFLLFASNVRQVSPEGGPCTSTTTVTRLLKVNKGSNAVLPCIFFGVKSPRVPGWTKNGEPVEPDARRNVRTSGFCLLLQINNVQRTDEGIFECKTNKEAVLQRIRLIVAETWRLEADTHHLVTYASRTAQLNCSSSKEKSK
eukprot:m.96423 g.96423  ORF g.96423 m.96423 type:complete len:163 (+) comp36909_c0_seq6:183-671(+)